jgi:hypothetical protein
MEMKKAGMIFKTKRKKMWGIIPHECSSNPYKRNRPAGDFINLWEKVGEQ